jgi:riboflavin synthase
MFTGIIQTVGALRARRDHDGDCTLAIEPGAIDPQTVQLGDSIAVNGVCLTVIAIGDGQLEFDVSAETLAFTTLGGLALGTALNLETAATPSTALGGHIVSGHVDGIATVMQRTADARSVRFEFVVADKLARYLAAKGSVCLDGISLTVNGVNANRFDVNIVPHTLSVTTMNSYALDSRVNLEVDVVARYVERLLDSREGTQ